MTNEQVREALVETRVLGRVARRLLPAKLELQAELGVASTAFALGQVFFFTAYAIFEVAGNLAPHRVGASADRPRKAAPARARLAAVPLLRRALNTSSAPAPQSPDPERQTA